MKISSTNEMCERPVVMATPPMPAAVWTAAGSAAPHRPGESGAVAALRPRHPSWVLFLWVAVFATACLNAQTNQATATNSASTTNAATVASSEVVPVKTSPPARLDESAFRIIGERNIFNANRSGGRVQLPSARPRRIETFTLVGTMAYAKGAFAFFDGSSSEFSKVAKANDVIAGHKLVDVLADGVKLEADGKQFELHVGAGMRREDAGAWLVAETGRDGNGAGASAESRTGEAGSRASRSSRGSDSGSRYSRASRTEAPAEPGPTREERKEVKKEMKLDAKAESEILKRLMERREKE